MDRRLLEKKIVYAVTGGAVGLLSLTYYYWVEYAWFVPVWEQQRPIALVAATFLPLFVPLVMMAVSSWLAEQPNGARRFKWLLIAEFVIVFGGPIAYGLLETLYIFWT